MEVYHEYGGACCCWAPTGIRGDRSIYTSFQVYHCGDHDRGGNSFGISSHCHPRDYNWGDHPAYCSYDSSLDHN